MADVTPPPHPSAATRLAFRVARLAGRLPRGGNALIRLLARSFKGLGNYPIPTGYGTVTCDFRESVCWELIKFGEYRHWREDVAVLPELVRKGAIVLDVGANIGVTTMLYSRLARHVHAFEPSPRALKFLRQNVGRLPNVTIHEIALGEQSGSASFAEEAQLDLSHFSATGIEVPVRTIDQLALDPDFIKIDVEGFEHLVLGGAKETLKKGRAIILFEALDAEALKLGSDIIKAANPHYSIRHVGGQSYNYIAEPRPN